MDATNPNGSGISRSIWEGMRVVIADDHPLFRDGLRSLLEARGIDVVGEARNGQEAVDQARRLGPDIVLMDLAMPEVNGLAATRLISAELPSVKMVILTASEDDANLFEAIKSGAQGYLFKNLDSEEFFRLLDGVARGDPALTPGLARKLLGAGWPRLARTWCGWPLACGCSGAGAT